MKTNYYVFTLFKQHKRRFLNNRKKLLNPDKKDKKFLDKKFLHNRFRKKLFDLNKKNKKFLDKEFLDNHFQKCQFKSL